MKRILYATVLVFCFNNLQPLDIKKIKNRSSKRNMDVIDLSEDGVHPGHQWSKRPIGKKIINWRRAKYSSSIEKMKYQDEFRELYKQKKKEAFDTETPKTDVVNMVAARPWGVPCGDPDQHDMPWGSCMRPEECAPEYRVHRGDYFCGWTTFVCCALQFHDYDPYGPLDASFGGSDFEPPTEEKLAHTPQEHRSKKSRDREENRRLREEERSKRKKRMKKIIKKIVREIESTFRNESRIRKKKTRQFKKFLKRLQRKYDKSKLLVRDQYRESQNRTDREGEERLKQIYEMNKQFIRNVTGWRRGGSAPHSTTEDTESSGGLRRWRAQRIPTHRDVYIDYDFYG